MGSSVLKYIKIETVSDSPVAAMVPLAGRVSFDEDKTQRVASPIDGRAVSILVHPGDKVEANQPLVELSSPVVGQLQSDALKARQDLSLSEKARERARKLVADGAVSAKELAQIEADYHKASSDVARTSAQLQALGLTATEPAVRASLRARIGGTVVERSVLVGQEIRADTVTPLLTITNLESVWILADAYEQDLSLVHEQANVIVRVPAYPGEEFPGKVSHVGEIIDPLTRTVKICCVVPNPARKLLPEMFAKVELRDLEQKRAIQIPAPAVLYDGDAASVLVVTDKTSFRSRPVSLGPALNGKVRVLSGLKAGEKIVTTGALFLNQESTDD